MHKGEPAQYDQPLQQEKGGVDQCDQNISYYLISISSKLAGI